MTVWSCFTENPVLVTGICLACVLYLLTSILRKSGRNPFSIRYLRAPPQKLVTDRKVRDKVLKQRFKAEKVPETPDTIVIGSGISGLTTAVLLGRAGQKVLVLEQHDQAGGCCHAFQDKGYEFATGIHYVGELEEGRKPRVLLDQITEGQVTWVPLEKEFDTASIGLGSKARRYTMKAGTPEQFAAHLEKQFPGEKQAIDKFIELVEEGNEGWNELFSPKMLPLWLVKLLIRTGLFSLIFPKLTKYSQMTVRRAFEGISNNETLKMVLAYCFGDLGVLPSQLGMHHYGWLMYHFMHGGYYPLGGTSEIAYQIIPIIERYGGRVLVGAPVSKILTDDSGRAIGVSVHRNSGDVDIFAKHVVSGISVKTTFNTLLPKQMAQTNPLYKIIERVGPSVSFMTVFVGLSGTSEDNGLKANNTWAFPSANVEEDFSNMMSVTPEQATESNTPFVLFISFPSAKDPEWDQKYKGNSAALVIAPVPISWFSQWRQGRVQHRGDDYDDLKMKLGRQMWEQTLGLFPHLAGKLEYIDVGTPLSVAYYLGQPQGEMYGLDHAHARWLPETIMYLRPESGVPGLYLTGQDITSIGFVPAMYAGAMTAGVILQRNLFKDLTALQKEVNGTQYNKQT